MQLFVTTEMIAQKIKKMKDNKSPGVDGIPPKLLKEIVEQIIHYLQICLTCHWKKEQFLHNGKKQILRRYLRREQGTSQRITDQ